jgi:hypothetical protein
VLADACPNGVKGGSEAAAVRDERLLCEARKDGAGFTRERVTAGENEHERLAVDGKDSEARSDERHADKAGMEETGAERLNLLDGGLVAQLKRYAGVLFLEGEGDGRHNLKRGGGHKADAEMTGLAGGGAGDALLHGMDGGEQGFSVGEKGGAGGSEADAAAVAVKQGDAEVLLECLDLRAKRGLREVETARGLMEAERAGNLNEGADLPDFHGERRLRAICESRRNPGLRRAGDRRVNRRNEG